VVHVSSLGALVDGEVSVEVRARNVPEAAIAGLSRWSPIVDVTGDRLLLTLDQEADLPAVNRFLVEHGADVYTLQSRRPSLEELFIQILGTDSSL
ncbi:MAG: DUF4162 domain-containing protein, partial [Ardenticatenaceae bacterium]